jgi:hypothetical protein
VKRILRVGDVYQLGARRFEVTAFLCCPPEWRAIGVASGGGAPAREDERALSELEKAPLMSGGTGPACWETP